MAFKDRQETIEKFSRQLARNVLKNLKTFSNQECTEAVNEVSQSICQSIRKFNPEDKYVVNTHIFEKTHRSICLSASCVWESKKDGFLNIHEETEELVIVISIWGLSLNGE